MMTYGIVNNPDCVWKRVHASSQDRASANAPQVYDRAVAQRSVFILLFIIINNNNNNYFFMTAFIRMIQQMNDIVTNTMRSLASIKIRNTVHQTDRYKLL